MNRLTAEHDEKTNLWRKEQAALNHRVSELIAASERQRLERDKGLDKYREKATSYKQKLRLALQNVQTLAQRIARYELQLGAEREEDGGPLSLPRGSSGIGVPHGPTDMQQFLNMKDDELQAEVQKLIEEGNRRRQ